MDEANEGRRWMSSRALAEGLYRRSHVDVTVPRIASTVAALIFVGVIGFFPSGLMRVLTFAHCTSYIALTASCRVG